MIDSMKKTSARMQMNFRIRAGFFASCTIPEERLKQLNKTEKGENNEESSEHDGQGGS
jgi:hypothetical protein